MFFGFVQGFSCVELALILSCFWNSAEAINDEASLNGKSPYPMPSKNKTVLVFPSL